jgi:hypothetical protein
MIFSFGQIMKKILLGFFLIANSIATYATDSFQMEAGKNAQRMLCNKPLISESNLSVEDSEKILFISMDYYREYKEQYENLNSFIITTKNTGDLIPFGFNLSSHYLVSLKYKGQEINDGIHYVDQDGKIKTLKYPFETKSIHGDIYTTIDKDDNKVDMKLCIYNVIENQDGVSENGSLYKEMTVKFNEPTIIDLNNGYKVKIKLNEYKI